MIEDAKSFGEMVRTSRRALGLTQRQLAMVINTGERFIIDFEAGKPTCQIGKALAAARSVGIDLVDARSPDSDLIVQRREEPDIPDLAP